jgi:hypothetical protein
MFYIGSGWQLDLLLALERVRADDAYLIEAEEY